MHFLLLCEGKSDAILLSYLLDKLSGWKHDKKPGKRLALKCESGNQESNFYANGTDTLNIFAAGGKDNIPIKLKEAVDITKQNRNNPVFEKISIVFDTDDAKSVSPLLLKWINGSGLTTPPAAVVTPVHPITLEFPLIVDPPRNSSIDFLAIPLPPDSQGCLETFLLEKISELSPTDELIDKKTIGLMLALREIKTIANVRDRDKARLGCVLAINHPDWAFSKSGDRIRSVSWENMPGIANTFEPLVEFLR